MLQMERTIEMFFKFTPQVSRRLHRTVLCSMVFAMLTIASAPSRFAQTGQTAQPIVKRVSYDNDCTPPHQDFNNKIMRYGRVAVSSRAFPEGLRQRILSDYRKCNNDPFYGEAIETQIERVLSVTKSFNSLRIRCTGGSGNGSAAIGSYGHPDEESFSWGGWFGDVYNSLAWPVCGSGASPPECRAAADPWPYSQAAGIVWHEVMHTHGYTHGANDQDGAIVSCGYRGDATWNFQRNTMPYIVGDVVTEVIDRSARICGNMESCPNAHQLRLVDGFNSTTCTCVSDPASAGLGILDLGGAEVTNRQILPNGDWVGGWHFDTNNRVAGAGDYDGDRTDEIVVRSPWGIAILKAAGSDWVSLLVAPTGTRFGGWQLDPVNDDIDTLAKDVFSPQIVRKGSDFNGDVRDDLLIRSRWGIAILTLTGSTLTPLMLAANGTSLGGWRLDGQNDKIQKIGDFNGDNRDDILITSRWGIGLLTLSGSGLRPLMGAANGTSLGGWFLNVGGQAASSATDEIIGVGDFNDDGKDDIVIRSSWGIGILTLEGNTLTLLMAAPRGTRFGGWYSDTSDEMLLGDFNHDQKTDILVRSTWGMGILTLNSHARSLSLVMAARSGTRLGGWSFDARNDKLLGIGDFDGDGGDDIFIQSAWGIGSLALRGTTLQHFAAKPWRTLAGSWPLIQSDRILQFGRYQDSARSQVLIEKATN